jgi:hypothetical protein
MRATKIGWTLAIGTFLLLGILLPTAISRSVPSTPAELLVLVVGLYAASRIAKVVGTGEARFAEVTFWLFVYIWGWLAPAAQMSAKDYYWPGVYGEGEEAFAALLVVVCVVGWLAGAMLADSGTLRPPMRRRQFGSRVGLLALGGTALTAAGLLIIGPGTFLRSRSSTSDAFGALVAGEGLAQPELVHALITIPTAAALSLLLLLRRRARDNGGRHSRILIRGWMATLAGLCVLVANPMSNARYISGAIAISLLLAAVPRHRTGVARLTVLGLVVGVLLVFPSADLRRYESESLTVRLEFNRELLLHGDYDAFQQTLNGVRYVDSRGHAFGNQLAGSVLFWVPRSTWGGKPLPTGSSIADHQEYAFTNLSSPLWIEGYVDFGVLGTFSFGAVSGFVSRRLDNVFVSRRTVSMTVAAAPVFAGFHIILLRGPLMAVSAHLILWLLVLWWASKNSLASSIDEDLVARMGRESGVGSEAPPERRVGVWAP